MAKDKKKQLPDEIARIIPEIKKSMKLSLLSSSNNKNIRITRNLFRRYNCLPLYRALHEQVKRDNPFGSFPVMNLSKESENVLKQYGLYNE